MLPKIIKKFAIANAIANVHEGGCILRCTDLIDRNFVAENLESLAQQSRLNQCNEVATANVCDCVCVCEHFFSRYRVWRHSGERFNSFF